MASRRWTLLPLLSQEMGRGGSRTAAADAHRGLVLLNAPLPEPILRHCWGLCGVRICADGAANRLLSTARDLTPDLIVGDLDSASPATLRHYSDAGVQVRDLSEDQETTDLDKALCAAMERGCQEIVVAGRYAGTGGRTDHFFGVVQTLFVAATRWPELLGRTNYVSGG
eukprot:Hpha_TRINITY_DN1619_c0_g1::TRINITY_DN1619_c0_g1_i2::g.48664::m.48664/K00949/thiN, TPK1, THI80; thiamine pyrophosphokinase